MSLSLREQAIFTANALRKMANDLNVLPSRRDAPIRHIEALLDHANDLMRAVLVESEVLPAAAVKP